MNGHELNTISVAIGQLQASVDDVKRQLDRLPCIESQRRITILENRSNFEKGVIAVLVFIGTILTDYVVRKLF